MRKDYWWADLDQVLEDGDACEAFMQWIQNESNALPFNLHFSIVAFKKMFEVRDSDARKLAEEIHEEYLSDNNKLCIFNDRRISDRIQQRLQDKNFPIDKSLFDECIPYVRKFLQAQLQSFHQSQEFLDLWNSVERSTGHIQRPSTSSVDATHSSFDSKYKTNTHRRETKLTSRTLLRTQHDRDLVLGQSHVERLFGIHSTTLKHPYVCNATTSKNDSTVSSNLSNERKKAYNKEHPLVPNDTRSFNGPQPAFRHDTDDGRRVFADLLIKKLTILDGKQNRTEKMNEKIKEIDKRNNFSARDAVIFVGKSDSAYDFADDDDDLDSYVKRRMMDSNKPSPTRQSPLNGSFKNRRRSPRSCSPDRPKKEVFDPMSWSMSGVSHNMSSNSCKSKKPSRYEYDDDTSGIGSMATTYLSNASLPIKKKHRAMVFQKAREMSSKNQCLDSHNIPTKLSLKGSDGVPIVAHVPKSKITLKEFRKYMSISSKAKKRLYFKSHAEDPNAPYELLLVEDDASFVPVFEGCVAAECRSFSDSD
ncbi:unnamed protein product [Bursaphelenchus xylophilus]|uniref:(pine wood nematode) hypothetical protein n=1 Tax=Bursaphelenchus xylophilus TaxID=6326 RepID=A0A1I7SDR1_BURXY|nr:unnamed protein product [Bursaphelenchus xylophilus]CAG9084403.1 unnamed protein product [Bursaphelenchus xylophilus]